MSARQASKPPHLSDRAFGLALFLFLSAITTVRWLLTGALPTGLAAAAAAFLVAALCVPGALMPLNRLTRSLAPRLGIVSNYVLLAPFLWAAMTPVRLLMFVSGRDPMQRRFDPDSDSYLTPVRRATTEETLRDMF